MGCTPDGLPFVGALEGPEAGLWIQAGFNGHGMSHCFKAAQALVGMICGDIKEVDTWFPRSFEARSERYQVPFSGKRHHKPRPPGAAQVAQLKG